MSTKLGFDLTKIRPSVLKQKIESGKYTGDALTAMKKELEKREKNHKKTTKANTAKGSAPAKDVKKAAGKGKDKTPAKESGGKKKTTPKEGELTIRGYLREIITPKTGKVAAVTYSEAKKLVKEKFADRMGDRKEALYTSEFDGVIKELMKSGVITERKQTVYAKAEGPAAAKGKDAKKEDKKEPAKKAAKKKTAAKKKVEEDAQEEDSQPGTDVGEVDELEPTAAEINAALEETAGGELEEEFEEEEEEA